MSAAVQRATSGSGSQQSTSKRDSHACHGCGLTNNKADKCKFKEATCHACGKNGHIKRACQSKRKTMRGSKQTKWIDTDQQGQGSGDEGNSFYLLHRTSI